MAVSKEVTLELVWKSGSTAAAEKAMDTAKAKADALKASLDAVAAAGKAAAGAVAGIKLPGAKPGTGTSPPGSFSIPTSISGALGALKGLGPEGVAAAVGIEMVSKVLGVYYSFVKKSVSDTVGLLRSAGGVIFRLLAAPWRNFYDFFYRFIRWQITWGLIGLGAATEEFVRRSTSAFAEYELTIAKAVTTTGLLGAAAAAAKQQFMALGQQLSMRSMLSATEIAKQFYWLTSAGLTVPQAGRVAPGVIALAQATQAAPEQTSALVMSAMAAFHLEVDQTNRVVNTFAANIGTTLLTLDTLATALPYVGASAYQAGLSFETTNAAIGVLADNGLRASRMGTGLRGMFAALMAPTREAQSVLAKYGLSARDVNIQSEGLYKVLDRMAPIIKNQADMYLIMGRRTTEAANILISQRDKLRETEAAITGTNRAYEMQNQILSTLAGQWAMLKHVGLALMIQFGGGLGGALKPWVMFLRDFGENLFGTGKAGQLGEKLGQWISAQLTKVGKWILSGDAAKWWDRLVAGARMFWQALVWGYGVLKEVYAILKGLNTPENRALFVAMKDWAVGLVTSGATMALSLMAKYIGQLPQAFQSMLELIWALIPAAIIYAKIWVAIAALKANIVGDLMLFAGTYITLLANIRATAWMVGGQKQGTKLGTGLMQAGWGLSVGADRAAIEAINTLSGVQRWLEANAVPMTVVKPITDAHAAGGIKVQTFVLAAHSEGGMKLRDGLVGAHAEGGLRVSNGILRSLAEGSVKAGRGIGDALAEGTLKLQKGIGTAVAEGALKLQNAFIGVHAEGGRKVGNSITDAFRAAAAGRVGAIPGGVTATTPGRQPWMQQWTDPHGRPIPAPSYHWPYRPATGFGEGSYEKVYDEYGGDDPYRYHYEWFPGATPPGEVGVQGEMKRPRPRPFGGARAEGGMTTVSGGDLSPTEEFLHRYIADKYLPLPDREIRIHVTADPMFKTHVAYDTAGGEGEIKGRAKRY